MNALLTRLWNRFERRELELEVEEELHLHVELLLCEHVQRGMAPEEARAATLKRFGDLERIKNECVEICSKNRPLRRAFKVGAILVVLTGLVVRILSKDLHVAKVGDALIAIAISGRLLLYARSLSPSSFLPKTKTSSLSLFTGDPRTPVS